MIITAILILVALGLILIAETFKRNGFYYVALFFRIILPLYAMPIVVVGEFLPQELPVPPWALVVFALASAYSFAMFVIELFTPQKIYKSFLDVPRQVLYKMGSHGKCIVLTEKQAKKSHKNGETVYIHAIARVVYKPKDEEPQTPGIDRGMGKDTTVASVPEMQTGAFRQPPLTDDFLKKMQTLQAQLNKKKEPK